VPELLVGTVWIGVGVGIPKPSRRTLGGEDVFFRNFDAARPQGREHLLAIGKHERVARIEENRPQPQKASTLIAGLPAE
jgi:hypothetical protein